MRQRLESSGPLPGSPGAPPPWPRPSSRRTPLRAPHAPSPSRARYFPCPSCTPCAPRGRSAAPSARSRASATPRSPASSPASRMPACVTSGTAPVSPARRGTPGPHRRLRFALRRHPRGRAQPAAAARLRGHAPPGPPAFPRHAQPGPPAFPGHPAFRRRAAASAPAPGHPGATCWRGWGCWPGSHLRPGRGRSPWTCSRPPAPGPSTPSWPTGSRESRSRRGTPGARPGGTGGGRARDPRLRRQPARADLL